MSSLRAQPRWLLVSLLVLGLEPNIAQAQKVDRAPIDELVKTALKVWEVPGAAVVIVIRDKVVYMDGFGVRELGGKDPVTTQTVFAISSATKSFTTLALAMLIDEGKLDWDDPVRKHVPHFRLHDPLADANVTLRDLCSHRTGVGGHELLMYRNPLRLDEQVRRLALVKPSRSFRSGPAYQSAMFVVAGQAVASASTSSWSEFVKKRIFDPLGMESASFTTAEALKKEHATPHQRSKEGKVVPIPWYDFKEPNPAVSINASITDMSKWLQFQLANGQHRGKALVSPASLQELRMPQTIMRLEGEPRITFPTSTQVSWGLGWVVYDHRGRLMIAHGGLIDGMRALVAFVPNEQIGVAILCNLHLTHMNVALSNLIFDHLLGLPGYDWHKHFQQLGQLAEASDKAAEQQKLAQRRPGTKPTLPLAAYAGTYEDPAYGQAQLAVENGKLVWSWSSFRAKLEHYHFDTFSIPNDVLRNPLLAFQFNAQGEVTGFSTLDVDFKKVAR